MNTLTFISGFFSTIYLIVDSFIKVQKKLRRFYKDQRLRITLIKSKVKLNEKKMFK